MLIVDPAAPSAKRRHSIYPQFMNRSLTAAIFVSLVLVSKSASAENVAAERLDARVMQMPALSEKNVAFVYAGDIWLAPRQGGEAFRLSSPRGAESFPRFSPDGQWLAFTGNYEGNEDIYVMPVAGGEPLRITHHGDSDRLLGWYPDGQSLLFASTMTTFSNRVRQFFKVSAKGGLPEKLPVPYGEFGTISPDGRQLAYTPITTDFATWKRYRGGMAPDLWLFDLDAKTAKKVAPDPANDSQPLWAGSKIYFLSDRGPLSRDNLWVYDTQTDETRQVTHYTDFDVHFPSMGPDAIIYENGGRLFTLDLKEEKATPVDVSVVTDQATLRPRVEQVGNKIAEASVSPTGQRVVFEARGEIFSVPAEHGVTLNLTRSSGVAERYPASSPDGRWVAYFSDRTGEYELTVRLADGKGEEKVVTQLGPGFRYQPNWSPDSNQIVFIDSAMQVWLCRPWEGKAEIVSRELWKYQRDLDNFRVNWSADSRWFAFAGDLENQQTAIVLYDTKDRKRHQVTSGFFEDDLPVFDPDGKYLYYRSNRWFDPVYSEHEPTWIYANGQGLIAVPLRKDVPSPLVARNDVEPAPEDRKDEEKKEDKPADEGEKKGDADEKKKEEDAAAPAGSTAIEAKKDAPDETAEAQKKDADQKKKDGKPKAVEIDIEDFEQRAVVLPPGTGHFADLFATPGKIYFTRYPLVGSDSKDRPLAYYDLEKREEKRVLGDLDGLELSADGKKLLVVNKGSWFITGTGENQKLEKRVSTDGLEFTVDPRAEWHQLFNDAWRIERDFFYDPNLHGVDWQMMRQRYGKLINAANTRWDVNFILGELLGELNVSHAYRSGGDTEDSSNRSVGYLGCDFALEQGAYRISHIPQVAPWEYSVRSPLLAPGVKVSEGDWILAVNGTPMDSSRDPWAAFQGLANQTVILTVNDKPTMDGARDVLVDTIASEDWLRQYAWMEENRLRVDKLSGGRVGYIYVRDTQQEGQNQLYRQFRAQFMKPGLIIDERWNSGGQIPDRFIELLARKVTNYWGVRDGHDWQTPTIAHDGPKAMLANGWSGSGGDCFPWLFRENKLGPVIGTRTWGGLIGMTGAPPLIDGGRITVPTFGIYDREGNWIIEGHGVDPDIEVIDDPAALSRGEDPQLERAVAEILKSLDDKPRAVPKKPVYPNRAGGKFTRQPDQPVAPARAGDRPGI